MINRKSSLGRIQIHSCTLIMPWILAWYQNQAEGEYVIEASNRHKLAKKKCGEYRLCVDYRKLNTLTAKDRFPLPRIDDHIDKIRGLACFTTLDLTSGCYRIPVSEWWKRFTAFVTPDEQYEYNNMHFGVCNAPSVFQRLMNRKNLTAV